MSYIYSRALVEAYLPDNCSDTDASAQSNGNHTHKPCLWHDKMMEPSRLSQFGMMCKPLTESHGAELLMSFVEDFRAKTSAQPEKAQELKEKEAVCGSTWQGLLAKYDHNTSLWKTAQCSLLGDSDEFSETWPRWGTMQNGVSYLRQIPALRICEKESGLWPTPVASDTGMRNTKYAQGGTPLSYAVKYWPTPQASDNRDRGNLSTPAVKRRIENGKQVMLSMCVSIENGRLNPNWVEWLMGWPIGHADLKPLETGKYQEWQQQHSPS